jgi:hypothetical protein
MMPRPMTWKRFWTIVQHIRKHGIPAAPGQLNYLRFEINRMSPVMVRRMWDECPEVFTLEVTARREKHGQW